MSGPAATAATRAAAVAQYHRIDAIFTSCTPPHPSAGPPLRPEDDILGQLAVAGLLKQGDVFEVPLTREGDFSWPPARDPHIIVRRHTTRWPGGPAARALCVPKAPESTLIPRLVADLRRCERLDALDGARFRLVDLMRRCAHAV